MKRSHAICRNFVEVLEDRIAPATLTWEGSAGDGSWFNPQNWDANAVPGTNDTAILGISSTITLLTNVTVGSFQQSAGTFSGAGTLAITGDLLWSGGTMSGTGITSVAGSASVISGTAGKTLNRTLTNTGALAVTTPETSANFTFGTVAGQPGHLINTASGTVNVTAGGDFNPGNDLNSSIDNAGSWNFSGANGTTSTVGSSIAFNNTGSLNVTSGRVEPSGGGTNTGSVTIAGGATLDFSGDTHNFNTGSAISGPGTLEVSFGIWNFQAGSYNVGTTRISGGIANFEAPATTSSLAQSAGTLGGGALISVSGDLTWSGGTLSGTGSTTVAGSGSTISGTAGKTLNRTLTNTGTLAITTPETSANLTFGTVAGQPGHLINTANGTVNVTAGGDFNAGNDLNSSIENAGSWNFSGSTGTTSSIGSSIAFNNTGSLSVTSGRVEPSGGGTNTGSVTIGGSATLDFSGDTHNFSAGSAISGPGTLEVSFGIWSFQAGSYNVGATRISGGIANFEAPATTSSLAQSAGTLGGGALISVSGDLTWSSGTMSGTGSITVAGSGSTISGTAGKTLNRTLTNTGTLAITTPETSANLTFGTVAGQPGHLINTTSGTVNVTAGGDFNAGNDPNSSIENAGSWNFSGTTGTTSSIGSSIAFNNTGTVAVASGTFQVNGGGTNTGSITVANNAIMEVGGNTYNLNAGSVISGGGSVVVSFGTWNLSAGTYSVGATRVTGGAANFEVSATTNTLTLTAGTLDGGALLSVTGDLIWSGGTMTGTGVTSVAGSASTISGTAGKTLNRTLTNTGTLAITTPETSANLTFGTVAGQPGHLVNTASGTVNVTAGGDFNAGNDPNSSIDNAGSWNATGPTGSRSTVGSSIAFNNMGTVALASGTFEPTGGGTNTGSVTLGSGATLAFGGDIYNLNAGSAIGGAGTVLVSFGTLNLSAGSYNVVGTQVTGGTANFEVPATTTSLSLSGGVVGGGGVLSVSGDFTWSSGTMSGTGSTTVAGAASTIGGTAGKVLNRTLTNSGTLNITTPETSGNLIFGTVGGQPGRLINAATGTVNVTLGGDFTAINDPTSSIDNAGTWNFAGPVATTSLIGSTIGFKNSGALNVASGTLSLDGTFAQASGSTRLSGGAITTSSQLLINGGEFGGLGTVTGKVVNNGATVLPGDTAAGVLRVTGDYTQGGSGMLQVNVGGTLPGTQHDQLIISGTASLGGTLAVNLTNGYAPSASDVLKIVVAGTRTGTFSNVTAPGMLTANYTPTEVRLAIGTTPSISINDVSIPEGRSGTEDLTFTVALSGPSGQTVTVQFATANGTATAPEDYTARTLTTLTFLPGEVSKFIDVAVRGDLVGEGDETFFVNLSNPANATLADAQGQGTILNDEGGPTLSIDNVALAEGNSGTTTAIFTVTLSGTNNLPVTVQYATVNGTALAGEDYTALPLSTLTFAPGETSHPVVVTISSDSDVEPTEYLAVALSNPTNAAIAAGVGAGAILNDDFQVSSGKLSFPEPDGDVVTVVLKGASLGSANVTIGEDGSIEVIDLTQFASLQQAGGKKPFGLTVAVKTPNGGSGDGFTKVGFIKANGLGLGKVNVEGDLGQIMAGGGSSKAALKSLSVVGNFGFGGASRFSELLGALGKLSVGGSVQKISLQASGKVGKISIAGDLIGEPGLSAATLAAFAEVGVDGLVARGNPTPTGMLIAESIGLLKIGGSVKMGAIATTKDLGAVSVFGDFEGGGIFSEGGMKSVKVIGKLTSDDPSVPVTVTARNKLTSLVIGGDVENGSILVGYNKNEEPVNPDGQIGKVVVKGNWIASSLVAGVQDVTADGFGRNDAVIAGDTTPSVLSKIAKVVIKGTAAGSAAAGDHFGITAQVVGKLSIGGTSVPLSKGVTDDVLLDEAHGDFRVVELG